MRGTAMGAHNRCGPGAELAWPPAAHATREAQAFSRGVPLCAHALATEHAQALQPVHAGCAPGGQPGLRSSRCGDGSAA